MSVVTRREKKTEHASYLSDYIKRGRLHQRLDESLRVISPMLNQLFLAAGYHTGGRITAAAAVALTVARCRHIGITARRPRPRPSSRLLIPGVGGDSGRRQRGVAARPALTCQGSECRREPDVCCDVNLLSSLPRGTRLHGNLVAIFILRDF